MRSVLLFRYRHGISLSSRPTPSPRLSLLCLLDLIPRPRGVGCAGYDMACGCWHGVGLPAYFLTVPLSRSCSFATAAWFALRVGLLGCPSVLCRYHAREFPLHLIRLKRFNRCGFLSNHPSVACGDAISFNPIWPILSLLARSAISLVVLFLACGRMMRCRVLRPARLIG